MTRIETDLLGSREIPDDAWYGIHTLRAVENFPVSGQPVSSFPELIRGMVLVKKAAALANVQLGALPGDIGKAILGACDEVLEQGRCMDQFPIDVFQGGAGTSVNMNTNEVLANLALERLGLPKGRYDVVDPNDHVNRSQSTNDAYPTGFRMALDVKFGRLVTAVQALAEEFLAKGREFAGIVKLGRTQLQDAVPMTLGQEFTAFGVTLAEEVRHLEYARGLLLEVNLGATAIGTGLNTPPGYRELAVVHLARVAGRPVVAAPDLIEATSDTGAYVMAHATCKRLACKLSKVCNDLRLLSSGPRAGLNEINLPEMQAGSSIMPAKVNPVIPEVVNQVTFKVRGNDVTVGLGAEAGQLQLNAMEPVIAQASFESVGLLSSACDVLRERCVAGITANREVCERYVKDSISVVTLLNDHIGHRAGDEVGREAAATGRTVRDIVVERGLLDEATVDHLLSFENLTLNSH
ncbi:MAG: aspartate ammonia-lyase [Arachnia propionica]|uniref:aspartate ammonia-lyase n=1 Tax=Arachnia propionica TaxID=1750 RepID=UPI00270F3FBD|nr:aspartate ammonia-lyase [Arachnia propionica]